MFSLLEFQGQSSTDKAGTVEIVTEYHATKKPVWLIMVKLLGVAAMVAVGAAIAVPTLLELKLPLWQAIAITAGAMMVYMGIAFFFRPEPNTDNLGLCGGGMNDPFQYSDNINRFLWRAHCVLGPGRFTAETLLDTCFLLGIARGESEAVQPAEHAQMVLPGPKAGPMPSAFDATRPIAPLDPNRFAQSSGNFVVSQIQMDSQRYATR